MLSPPPSPQFSEGSQISSDRRSSFSRRFSSASSFSLASIRTILPQYSAADVLQPESPPYSGDISRIHRSEPTPRAKPRRKSHKSRSPLEGMAVEGFEYAFPIRPTNSWCSLRLYTQDLAEGNPKVSHHKPKTPKFWGGQSIAGLLELELDSPHTIQCILLTVRCESFLSPIDPLLSTGPVFSNSSEER